MRSVAGACDAEVGELTWVKRLIDARYGNYDHGVRLQLCRNGVEALLCCWHVTPPTLAAAVPGATGLALHIASGHVYPFGRALGFMDEEVGSEAFDLQFVVKTRDLPYARTWLSRSVRADMLAAYDYVYLLSDQRLEARGRYHEPCTTSMLGAAIRAVTDIAGRSRQLRDAWEPMAAAVGGSVVTDAWRADGSPAVAVDRPTGSLTIDVVYARLGRERPRLHTRVRARRMAASEPDRYALYPREHGWRRRPVLARPLSRAPLTSAPAAKAFALRAEQPIRASARFGPARGALLEALGADVSVLAERDRVELWLPGFCEDVERMRAAVALVERLAVNRPDSAGPYR